MEDVANVKRGPLAGVRVVEFGAIGPVPFCGMMLADMGAEVVMITRPNAGRPETRLDVPARGRLVLELDLKNPEAQALVHRLLAQADILLEGNRPGVAERLSFSPAACLASNPRLVFGRMTGWGQTGPLAGTAGHDINYIALTGALNAIGPAAYPVPPLNLVGDYGGGAMYLAFGVVCALLEARRSGQGQVIDAAMVDGAASLLAMFTGMMAAGTWSDARGANILDGGVPWYSTYRAADGLHVAVGALEEPFWQALLAGLEIAPESLPPRQNRAGWPVIREALATVFARRKRDEWAAHFAATDACVAPVLTLSEAPAHPQIAGRNSFIELQGVTQPAPAPRFSRTPGQAHPARIVTSDEILATWGAPAA